jgi:hypothetical protein
MTPQVKDSSAQLSTTQQLAAEAVNITPEKVDLFPNLEAWEPNYDEIYGFCEDMD